MKPFQVITVIKKMTTADEREGILLADPSSGRIRTTSNQHMLPAILRYYNLTQSHYYLVLWFHFHFKQNKIFPHILAVPRKWGTMRAPGGLVQYSSAVALVTRDVSVPVRPSATSQNRGTAKINLLGLSTNTTSLEGVYKQSYVIGHMALLFRDITAKQMVAFIDNTYMSCFSLNRICWSTKWQPESCNA